MPREWGIRTRTVYRVRQGVPLVVTATERSVDRPYPRLHRISPQWVHERPAHFEHGTLYIQPSSRVTYHLCPCGCGTPVYVDLHPDGWRMEYNGIDVSLWPSVGNYHQKCQSHYFIVDNKVEWCD